MLKGSVYIQAFLNKKKSFRNETFLLQSGQPDLGSDICDILFDILATCLVIFMTSTIADEFLVAILEALAKFLRMPDNVAGVTLLALGNGAPDIVTCKSGFIKGANAASLSIGALLGAALFDFLLVFGIVTLSAEKPFRNASRPFLRDIIFYIIGSSVVMYIVVYGKQLTLGYTLLVLSIYISYIIVVIGARYVRVKFLLTNDQKSEDILDDEAPIATAGHFLTEESQSISERPVPLENSDYEVINPFGYSISVDSEDSNSCLITVRREFIQTLKDFSPLNLIDTKSKWMVVFSLAKAIIIFPVRFSIHAPENTAVNENDFQWHRLTVSTQTFIGCIMLAFLTLKESVISINFPEDSDLPVLIYFSIGGLVLALATYFLSKPDKAPKFYPIFLVFNFLICFLIASTLVDFLVDRISDVSQKFSIKPAIMGMTFLAWGNSLGDIASNGAMARNGKPRVGVAACFAGQFLNLLLGVSFAGISSIISGDGDINFETTVENVSLWVAIVAVSFFKMFLAIFVDFKHSKFWCFFLIVIYFLIIALIYIISKITSHR